MKVLHLFVWTHALGSQALLLPQTIRNDALVALSSLQIVCYSVRGSRPYTEAEHRFVFSQVGRQFWRAVTNITHHNRQMRIASAEAYNVGKPPAKRRRVPHWRAVQKLTNESSDTASSTDDDVPPCFLRSDKIVPHSFQHFADQVIMGGTHLFHDTSLSESSHKVNLGRAGSRSRTYHDMNLSSAAMMNFLHEDRLLSAICEQAMIDVDEGHPTQHTMCNPQHTMCTPQHNTTMSPTTCHPQHTSMSPTTCHPQFTLMSPTTCHPQHVTHNMSPTTYSNVTHNVSPTTYIARPRESRRRVPTCRDGCRGR